MQDDAEQKNWLDKLSDMVLREPKDLAELIAVIKGAKNNHIINTDALNMIEGVISISEKQVRDVMIPRPKMVILDSISTAQQVLPTITESGHSRFPVLDHQSEKITGILLAKDLLKVITDSSKDNIQIQRLTRPAKMVPESKRLDILLNEFRENRLHMAIVIDEYGRTAGLVTLEDLLEEIVGEIADEFDQDDATPFIQQKDKTLFMVDALTPMEDFNEYFHTTFSHEDFDTIGGLLLKKFNHIPKKGEQITLAGLHFTIINANSRVIKEIKVQSNEAI